MKRRTPGTTYAAHMRRAKRNEKLTCRCNGWPFPHRVGSMSSPFTSGLYKGERYGCTNG